MGVYRARKTLTLEKGEHIEKDAYVDQGDPNTAMGLLQYLMFGGASPNNLKDSYATINLPSAPQNCETSLDYEGIYSITLKLYCYNRTTTKTSPMEIRVYQVRPSQSWAEDTITWNNDPDQGAQISTQDVAVDSDGYKDFELDDFTLIGKTWDDELDCYLRTWDQEDAKYVYFRSREDGTIAELPYLAIEYYLKTPAMITDLAIEPDSDDATRPRLTWTPSTDENFHHYEIWRKVGAGAWAQVGSDITVQGVGEYVDTAGGLTENNVIYYKIRVEGSEGDVANDRSYVDSNEVWMIRPDVSTFTVSDTTPDVLQELTFTVAVSSYPSTPTPVTNEWYEYFWGTSSEDDNSSARVRETNRTHRYPYYGTSSQTPKMQVENSLGFKSDKTSLTSGGPALTVADINPVAVLRASPVVVAVNENVRFFGDESYAPAGNQELAAADAFEWDKDYSVSFSIDDATTVPYKDYSWASSGTKTVALRVKDADSKYSTHVTIDVEVVQITTVDLDSALTDGYEVIDPERGRTIMIQDGLESKKINTGSEKITAVRIAGFAYTDTDVDGTPDDIETLEDIVTNDKRVQLSVHGTVRYGTLKFRTHEEGGWEGKAGWTAEVYLE